MYNADGAILSGRDAPSRNVAANFGAPLSCERPWALFVGFGTSCSYSALIGWPAVGECNDVLMVRVLVMAT